MKFRYRVYHSATADKFAAAHNLSAQDEQHEYDHFPGSLSHLFDHDGIIATSEPAEGESGVIVTLETERGEDQASAALADLVSRLNKRSPALCLLIDRR
jgi:hypothetical protein